ncbi:hypothetical protein KDW_26830 [Dictyobacter vulcani]|uniref:3-keto-disaccharide hydrolase domain-containing protein n=1 Tax=Dictyobacter vulcani TaxID=2607529 RepID=A0A5J4KQ67_9CHLR|nr:hypothetical protein [Dictyobacter vulcani]GER88521.1 hypothetical protein KDW_26830 [Dictyobacter vulcani]
MFDTELRHEQADTPTPFDQTTNDPIPEVIPTTAARPVWPPPPRPRKRRSKFKQAGSTLAIILTSLLLLSCLALILFKTSTNYRGSLRHVATIEVQQTRSVQNTAQAQVQGTARYFQTAQSEIEATATAEGNQAAIATQTVNDATATATANENSYQTIATGKALIDDPMLDNSGTSKWDTGGPAANTGCSFTDSAYHVREAQQMYLQPCLAQGTNVEDSAYQADVSIIAGNPGQAGLLLRANSAGDSYYFFHVGSDGSYALDLYNGTDQAKVLLQGFSDAITPGLQQTNQLMILAHKNSLMILANGHYLGMVSDDTLTGGKIGVAVINNGTPIDATFTNVQVWRYEAKN